MTLYSYRGQRKTSGEAQPGQERSDDCHSRKEGGDCQGRGGLPADKVGLASAAAVRACRILISHHPLDKLEVRREVHVVLQGGPYVGNGPAVAVRVGVKQRAAGYVAAWGPAALLGRAGQQS